ncbi:SGNH/GDSL hydrolase family protein [Aeromicrobium sp. CF4.19]|uniref:SGNH/GDSL hydrolase family protein n=1 Tax=Aeromicrobium sp. CF4.19 TaxID=3373082 RepID=UPI003EE56F98
MKIAIGRGRGRRVMTAVMALALAGSLLAVQAAQSAHAGDGAFPDGIVVVGDSITARYGDDAGADDQAWWSFVGRHYDADVRTYAQSGSGYQRHGLQCTGDRFIDRHQAFDDPPSVFLIQGGRNDWSTCRDGRRVRSTDAAVADAVVTYLRQAQKHLPQTTRIVVLGPPWGEMHPWEHRRITSIVRTAASREDLEYVSTTGTLDRPGHTADGVHPTRAGSMALGERVIAALSRPPG